MKVIIIDDEALARKYVSDCLSKFPEYEVVAECADGFEGLIAIKNLEPDLIFLDIQMPRINGFEMLELIENPPAVIFATAFDEYAFNAFEANAIDYLLKPFSIERFERAIQKMQGSQHLEQLTQTPGKSPEEQNRIVLRHQGEIRILNTSDILYLEAWDDYVKIHTASTVYVKKQTLAYYENSLNNKEFVRCHRSYIVNIQEITALDHHATDSKTLRLKSGFHLPVSRQGYVKLKSILGI